MLIAPKFCLQSCTLILSSWFNTNLSHTDCRVRSCRHNQIYNMADGTALTKAILAINELIEKLKYGELLGRAPVEPQSVPRPSESSPAPAAPAAAPAKAKKEKAPKEKAAKPQKTNASGPAESADPFSKAHIAVSAK